eukprot:1021941-Pelagomonas_calceolata.AAC.3
MFSYKLHPVHISLPARRSSMPNHPLAPAQPDPHQRHHPTQDSPHTAPDLPLIPAHCSLRDHSEDLPVCCDTADTIRGTLASFSCCLEGDQKGRSPGGCCTLLHTSGRLGRQRSSSSGMLSSYCPSPCTSPRPSRLLHHAPGQHADGEVLSNKCRVSAGPERDDVWVRSQLSRDLHQDNSEEMSCAHAGTQQGKQARALTLGYHVLLLMLPPLLLLVMKSL